MQNIFTFSLSKTYLPEITQLVAGRYVRDGFCYIWYGSYTTNLLCIDFRE